MSEHDPFAFDLEDEDDSNEDQSGSPKAGESKNFADLRKYARKMERERNAFEKELTELRDFKSSIEGERKEATIKSAFEEVGLNPKHAALFSRVHEGEVTVDAVKAFASEYELPTTEGAAVEPPVKEEPGFRPVVTGTPTGAAKLSAEDIKKMLSSGEIEAVNKAYAEGRVEREETPWRTELVL